MSRLCSFTSFSVGACALVLATAFSSACGAGNHELLVAIRARDQARVDAYLRAHGDMNFHAEENGWSTTPLIQAVRVGNQEAVRQLVAAGADPMFPNEEGLTPIEMTCKKLELETLRVMLAAGDGKSMAKRAGSTCLHAAHLGYSAEKEIAIVNLLAESGFDLVSAAPSKKWGVTTWLLPPFHAVVTQNKTEVAKAYLERGVPVDLRDAEGRTALVYAVALNRFRGSRFVLQNGADPAATDRHGLGVLAAAKALTAGLPEYRAHPVFEEAFAVPLATPAERVAAFEVALAKQNRLELKAIAEREAKDRRKKEEADRRAVAEEARRSEARRRYDENKKADPDFGLPEICRTPENRACRATGKTCEQCFLASIKPAAGSGSKEASCTYQQEACGSDCCTSDYRCCVFDKGAGFVCRKKGESCGGWGWQTKTDWQRGMP